MELIRMIYAFCNETNLNFSKYVVDDWLDVEIFLNDLAEIVDEKHRQSLENIVSEFEFNIERKAI